MNKLIPVLFSFIVMFLSGCSVVNKGAGVIHTSSPFGSMSHWYTERSGLTVVNPSKDRGNDLRMKVTYSVHMRLDRSSPLWGESQRLDPYPIVEVYRETLSLGAIGQDVFVSSTHLTNHKNILRVIVEFYRDGVRVGDFQETERWVSFYQGTWQSTWYPGDPR